MKSIWIILTFIFGFIALTELIFIVYVVYIGGQTIINEQKCSDYCYFEDAESYDYDEYYERCLCYKGTEIVSIKDIGG